MLNFMTIRNKLIVAVGIAIIGFAVLGGVSLQVLVKLANTSAVVEQSQHTAMVVSRTETEMVKLSLQKAFLTSEQIDSFKQQISQTKAMRAAELQQSAQASHNENLAKLLGTLELELKSYMDELSEWLVQKEKFGLDENSGLLGDLRQAASKLEEGIKGFTIAEHAVGKVLGTEKVFLLKRDTEQIKWVDAYLIELKNVLIEMDFIEEYGHLLLSYKNAFHPVANQLIALQELEKGLNKRVPLVEQTVISTVDLLDNGVIPAARLSAAEANSQARVILIATALLAAIILSLVMALVCSN